MSRTLRSEEDRQLLFEHQKGLCAICGKPLDPNDWHADHIIPWSRGGRTNVHAMQAVCPRCNLQKGAKMSQDEKNQSTIQAVQPDPNDLGCLHLGNARRCQREAFNTAYQKLIVEQRPTVALILATGAGKTDLYRMIAYYLRAAGHISTTLTLSPTSALADQMVYKNKMNEFVDRYNVHGGGPVKWLRIEHLGKDYGVNGEFLLSATIQFVHQNFKHFADWIEWTYVRTGRPVLILPDETHQYTLENCWGGTVEYLVKESVPGIVMPLALGTATPWREKGSSLIGFDLSLNRTEETIVKEYSPSPDDPSTTHVKEWFVKNEIMTLKGDYEYGFREAVDEGVICEIQRVRFPVDLVEIGMTSSTSRTLSDISESATRSLLGKIVRDPIVIEAGVNLMLEHFRRYRQTHPETQGIIFCSADQHRDHPNKHPRMIQSVLSRAAPDLNVVIATSANDDHSTGKHVLKAFCDPNPVGDILIVKQMAGLGLDNSRLKVGLELSANRMPVSACQRANRLSRIHKGLTVATWVTPEDILYDELSQKYLDNVHEAEIEKRTLVGEYDIPKGTSSPRSVYDIVDVPNTRTVVDQEFNVLSPDDYARAHQIAQTCPLLAARMTYIDLSKLSDDDVLRMVREALAKTPTSAGQPVEDVVQDTGECLNDLCNIANDWCKKIVKILFAKRGRSYDRSSKIDREMYTRDITTVWNEAKVRSGVGFRDIRGVQSIQEMESLIRALKAMHQEYSRAGRS